jgi:hypothetical protein
MSRVAARALAIVAFAVSVGHAPPARAGTLVRVPLDCTKGPSGQTYATTITMPETQAAGTSFTVRIEGVSSGAIAQTGLRYVHDMAMEYLVPRGTRFVSARFAAGTGSDNVRATAKLWHDAGVVHVLLPAHVENGASYTPPTVELELALEKDAGKIVALEFARYAVKANAIVVGDVDVSCDPKPKPYRIGTTSVVP